jgi:hypothetical protein
MALSETVYTLKIKSYKRNFTLSNFSFFFLKIFFPFLAGYLWSVRIMRLNGLLCNWKMKSIKLSSNTERQTKKTSGKTSEKGWWCDSRGRAFG